MDLDQLNALPNSAKEKYMLLGKLFDHPGFKYLKEWSVAQVAEAQNRVLFASTWDQHVLNRGAQMAYQNVANLEEITEAEFEEVANNIIESKKAEEAELEADGV